MDICFPDKTESKWELGGHVVWLKKYDMSVIDSNGTIPFPHVDAKYFFLLNEDCPVSGSISQDNSGT